MKITKNHLKKLIREAMFDAERAFRDAYSQLDPEQMDKLDRLRKSDPADFHLQVDSLGDYQGPRMDSLEDLMAQSDMMLRMYGVTFSDLEPLLSQQQLGALNSIEQTDVIVIGKSPLDGIQVMGVPGLDDTNFYDIIEKINSLSGGNENIELFQALVHLIISRAPKTKIDTFDAEELGILEYKGPTKYMIDDNFADLYAADKLVFTGMTRKKGPVTIITSKENITL